MQKQSNSQNQQQSQQNQNNCDQLQEQSKWIKLKQPDKCIELYMIDFNHCDRKKCTGRKMQRFKLLKNIKDKKKKFKGIVLSAYGTKLISFEDLSICEKIGICVIDCSWNRIEETKQFRYKHQRKLPYVIAGNPINYGKAYQLSCVEALATTLCALNYYEQAQMIMSKFGWADGFWKQNQWMINYCKCSSLKQIEQQSKINENKNEITFQRQYEMPISSDEDDN